MWIHNESVEKNCHFSWRNGWLEYITQWHPPRSFNYFLLIGGFVVVTCRKYIHRNCFVMFIAFLWENGQNWCLRIHRTQITIVGSGFLAGHSLSSRRVFSSFFLTYKDWHLCNSGFNIISYPRMPDSVTDWVLPDYIWPFSKKNP